jgi:hypothetical protein
MLQELAFAVAQQGMRIWAEPVASGACEAVVVAGGRMRIGKTAAWDTTVVSQVVV